MGYVGWNRFWDLGSGTREPREEYDVSPHCCWYELRLLIVKRSLEYRYIAVLFFSPFLLFAAKNCSLHIELDPLRPRMLPEFRFMGSDAAIAPIRAQLNSRISEWYAVRKENYTIFLWYKSLTNQNVLVFRNSELSLLQNIRNVIQVELPSPMNSKKEEFSAECGICYAYRIGDAIPDKVCVFIGLVAMG